MTSASSLLQDALEDAEKVVKKQKTCCERVDACLDQLISLVQGARASLASAAAPGAVPELKKQIQKLGIEKEMNGQTKELHTAVGRLNKVRRRRWRRAPQHVISPSPATPCGAALAFPLSARPLFAFAEPGQGV
jgi:hypothetical protein